MGSFVLAQGLSSVNGSLLVDVVQRLQLDIDYPAELLPIELPNISAASTIDLLAVYDDINTLEVHKAQFDKYSSLFDENTFTFDEAAFKSIYFLLFYIIIIINN